MDSITGSVKDSPKGGDRLILFDVNGILCTKISDWHLNSNGDMKINSNEDLDGSLKVVRISPHYAIVVRPGIRDYLVSLATQYTIGIYSSTTYANVSKILQAIFTAEQPFTIIADRSVTKLDPRYGIDPSIKSFDTVKTLDRIWEHPIFNAQRQWNASNTLLIDHDRHKIDLNAPENILVVPEFTLDTFQNQTNSIAELEAAISAKLEATETSSIIAKLEL